MVVATVLLLSPDIPGISVGQLALVLGVIASTTAGACAARPTGDGDYEEWQRVAYSLG